MARTKKATTRPLMPKVDYTDFINTLAREHARHRTATVEERILRNNPNFEEDVFRNYLEYLKEKFEQWRELGNHYADVLENPTTTAVLHNTIGEDLDELADQAKLDIASPEVLRLLYPLLRYRALDTNREGV